MPIDDGRPLTHPSWGWEPLAVYPAAFVNLSSEDGRCTNDNGGIDLHSIAGVVLKPSNGYPVSFFLLRDSQNAFTGKYGEDGTGIISVNLRVVEAMIQQKPREGRFLAYIWSPE
jgi:hypothetical protein